eukprot:Gb_03147 [translate_table: standard]
MGRSLSMFEEGLYKSECKLLNCEAWRPTFIANMIQILVRDLVSKQSTLTEGVKAMMACRKVEESLEELEERFQEAIQDLNNAQQELQVLKTQSAQEMASLRNWHRVE